MTDEQRRALASALAQIATQLDDACMAFAGGSARWWALTPTQRSEIRRAVMGELLTVSDASDARVLERWRTQGG